MEATSVEYDLQLQAQDAHRQEMMTRHLSLVHHVARQFARSSRLDVEIDDLVSAGTLGLISAIDHFDASRGLRFSTFAAPRIRGAILDDLRRRDHVPRSIRRKQRALAQAEDAVASKFNRAPSAREVAKEAGIDMEKLHRWKWDAAQAGRVSLDSPDPEAPESTVKSDMLAGSDGSEIEGSVNTKQEIAVLRNAILELKEQERIVLSLYYFEELKLHEIAKVLGVTESRISQIHAKAVGGLRKRMGGLRGESVA